MKHRIISEWVGSADDFLKLNKGDIVTLGKSSEDSQWKNWRECIVNEKSGWAPIQIINILSDHTGEISEDYSAYELTVQPGECFVSIKELNDWFYGYVDTKKPVYGWIPKHITTLI